MIDTEMRSFFKGPWTPNEVLLLTTFTLDESILLELLQSADVPRKLRIVVYHDILRHRCPGLLKTHFQNSSVYSVVLDSPSKSKCPVFHSKIWARLVDANRQMKFKRLAVTSANLSAYHLLKRKSGGTIESFVTINSSGMQLPKSFLFERQRLFQIGSLKSHERLNVKPETLCVEDRRNNHSISLLRPSENVIDILNALNETPILCAAPFISKSAVSKINEHKKAKYFTGAVIDNNGTFEIHAKVFQFTNTIAMGSVNWTAQALLGLNQGCINHETLLLVDANTHNVTILEKGAQYVLNQDNIDCPGDSDPDDPMPDNAQDWLNERKYRIDSPLTATLEIRPINNGTPHCSIVFDGLHSATTVQFTNKRKPNESISLAIRKNRAEEPHDSALMAQILSQGAVELVGFNGENKLWKCDLDYGPYWHSIEKHKIEDDHKIKEGKALGLHKNMESECSAFYDVREMRCIAMKHPERDKRSDDLLRWLHLNQVDIPHIPEWCTKLSHDIAQIKRRGK